MIELVSSRLKLGKTKYGHGVRTHMDTTTWGTPKIRDRDGHRDT